jgi:hypothetical protein
MSNNAWFGFDIDKTIAVDEGKIRGAYIGAPIKPLIRRMKYYLRQGRNVAVVTARVHPSHSDGPEQAAMIRTFLVKALGADGAAKVAIRCDKDRHMIVLYDDRVEQVIPNKGILVKEELRRAVIALKQIAGSARGEPYGTHAALAAREALDSLDEWSLALVPK